MPVVKKCLTSIGQMYKKGNFLPTKMQLLKAEAN